MKTKLLILTIFAMSAPILSAQTVIDLFPNGAPQETTELKESIKMDENTQLLTNVSKPTLTLYPVSNGTTWVVVCPGGGYHLLAYDKEGTEICTWLNSIGVSAALLKYRVPRREGREKHEAPLQDAQRAISYLRSNAQELHLNPNKIGIIGFSAGAHLSTMTSTTPTRTYTPIDKNDKVSTQPNFCLLIYPAYHDGKDFTLAPEIKITPTTPPTFIVQSEDDKNYINSAIFYYYHLKEAGVPATMHLYANGGHGFGLRKSKFPCSTWPLEAAAWLKTIGAIQ